MKKVALKKSLQDFEQLKLKEKQLKQIKGGEFIVTSDVIIN